MAKIAMIIAKSEFRDEEYLHPKEEFLKNGHEVITASSTLGECTGRFGAKVTPDIDFKELTTDDFDALVFVGGGGSSEYFDSPIAHGLAREAYRNGKIVSAICIAPVILSRAGLLQGKKATVYPDGENDLVKGGAFYTGNPVEVDERIVTGNGPAAARDFAKAVMEALEALQK
ncbi:MAG: DJ-1/PfpI family protein [Bacillota bacterium]|nr:DJ-1/PfpI family protein [Bacillota bacterium]NLU54521.1 DJ-1/PfpI family protein [Bacillota bacterium]HOA91079.1 DJ-1/PfpI family protein [Bacillota bacterium]HOJ46792.1 DJ-1/PfpI family protein [Bacillota bacterium]HOL13064.1 DJ-1/PfpI family protein [Bacillota bacterium]